MDRARLPLNALRAFETAARHLNFTRAALELRVSQTALSHQIKALEDRLGFALFRRLPRGVALTDEGAALVPVLHDAFERIGATLDRCVDGTFRDIVTIGVVATFATGWLMHQLPDFAALHPEIDLRMMTNNNRVDLAGEGLDFAIRFGDGAWHGVEAREIMPAPLTPMCSRDHAERVTDIRALALQPLLRSYRADEWVRYFEAAGVLPPAVKGHVFDSSLAIAQAAMSGAGFGLLPRAMFTRDLAAGRLVAPYNHDVDLGRYWLTRLNSRPVTAGMRAFANWVVDRARVCDGAVA
jgi:LysR family transcriptional regulator, regulator of gene expression of beta-lactamase